ncbi:50S ribosomal protein L13 [Patescibacteria group bacterium]|nr:50S ribosomal protein L13 [Patescibacteria group bacterium]
MIYKIDANDKILGRLAAEIAAILRGKNKPDFLPHKLSGNKVIVFNVSNIKVSGNKFEDKIYYRHSNYPGGIKAETYKQLVEKDPTLPLRKAVRGMLPDNKLRAKMLNNLELYAGEHKKEN